MTEAPETTVAADEITSPGTVPVQLGFAVLCVQKAVEFNVTDHKLHRATKDKELHEELEKLTEAGPSTYLYQLGGGCRVVGTCGSGGAPISSACVGDSVAAFQGTLTNLADLAATYVPEPQAGPGQATPAEVICHMYLKVGVELLAKLRGRFAFCMYESKQGRVLAARDGSGAVHLYQGHSPTEGLVISTTRAMLQTCSDIKTFSPGDFKYGWHSEPRQFSPIEFTRRGRQSNQEGGRRGSMDQAGERHSIDRSNMNHANGGHPRNSLDRPNSRRTSVDRPYGNSRRTSIDSTGSWAPSVKGPQTAGDRQLCPQSPLANQLRGLSVNAPEFQPGWNSPAVSANRNSRGVHGSTFGSAASATPLPAGTAV